MIVPKYSAPITAKVAIDRRRRISLPRCLQVTAPFILFEVSDGDESWLGLCEAGAWAEVSKRAEGIQILAQHLSSRPTLPAEVCRKYGLGPDMALRMVTVEYWVEIWSERRWGEQSQHDLFFSPD